MKFLTSASGPAIAAQTKRAIGSGILVMLLTCIIILSASGIAQGNCSPPYVTGDANGNGAFNGIDVTYSVNYFKGGPVPPYTCNCAGSTWYVAGDVNESCNFNGIDVTRMIACLKGFMTAARCNSCP